MFVASADDPQPCCLPIRYSSRMIQVGGSVALGPNPQGQMIDVNTTSLFSCFFIAHDKRWYLGAFYLFIFFFFSTKTYIVGTH